jgi:hypothetical protein
VLMEEDVHEIKFNKLCSNCSPPNCGVVNLNIICILCLDVHTFLYLTFYIIDSLLSSVFINRIHVT